MAASFASSYARDRNREDVRRREVVADVGTGLVVSRLVHGPSRRIEEDYQRGRKRRGVIGINRRSLIKSIRGLLVRPLFTIS
jgi:hypothetical protein